MIKKSPLMLSLSKHVQPFFRGSSGAADNVFAKAAMLYS
jgi:hypothetical protein